MSKPLYAPAPSSGGDFLPPPAGTHVATCYRLVDLGTQTVEWQGELKKQHKIMVSWELPDELMQSGQPFSVHQRYTLSMHEKATLRKHLEAWRGKAFDDESAGAFDISSILGKACFLSIIHATKGDKTYANISGVSKLPKNTPAPAPINPRTFFSLAEPDWTLYGLLSQGLQAVIAKSPEYETARHGPSDATDNTPADEDFHDDSIPF
jgi:hypothetical protein